MIEKLRTLESALSTLRQQYALHLKELKELKSKPTTDASDYNELKAQLNHSHKKNEQLLQEKDALQQKLIELDERYQSLAEAHHMIGEEQDKLQLQVDELTQLNEVLQQKNRQAAEHTKYALQQLTKIDQTEL